MNFVSPQQAAVSRSPANPGAGLLDQSALTDLAQRLVEAAKRAGADAADAVAVRGVAQSIEIRDGNVEESERSEGDDVGLRVLVGRRQAVVSSNDRAADAKTLAERAVAMARVAPEDEFAGLADPALLAKSIPDLDLLDPNMPGVDELERAEQAALAVKGVSKSGGASASAGIGGMVLVTSTGFCGSYLRSSHGVSMTAIAGQGTGMERDYDFSSALHGADLASPDGVGRKAAERAIARVNPLIGHLIGAINGASIARKTSFLKDKLGAKLFKDNIRIVDDPLRKRGLRSQPFDAEGVAVKPMSFIDGGVLTSWILDSATGRELGLATNGHAHRGVSSSPSPGSYNLHMEPGQDSPEALISDIKEGFYITDLIGSGVNGVTGDYSRGASGFWIENGCLSYPVSEVTIAGHLFDIFKSLTPASDLTFRYGVDSPTVRIEGLTVAGR
jgi:PmbA protein